MKFSYLIIKWYEENKRDLPWRHSKDPYMIWVSEMILQQTRVEQGLDYYNRFVERFPDIRSLAMAEEDEVMKIWQGLGYYSRARNMHHSAKSIFYENKSEFPASYDEILRMKGVGDYSASAISSIAYGESHPVVDGNVLRVVARFEGIMEPINSSSVRRNVKDILRKYIDDGQPGTFNQAIMELGALVCKPKKPLCAQCPVMKSCHAFRNETTAVLPVMIKAKRPKVRFFNYLVIISREDKDDFIWLKKRSGNDIWRNLYDFPLIESDEELSMEVLLNSQQGKVITGPYEFIIEPEMEAARHLLTHRELRVNFIFLKTHLFYHEEFIKVRFTDVHKYPVPRLIENILKKL